MNESLNDLRKTWLTENLEMLSQFGESRGLSFANSQSTLAIIAEQNRSSATNIDDFIVETKQRILELIRVFNIFTEFSVKYQSAMKAGVRAGMKGVQHIDARNAVVEDLATLGWESLFKNLQNKPFELRDEKASRAFVRGFGKFSGAHYREKHFRQLGLIQKAEGDGRLLAAFGEEGDDFRKVGNFSYADHAAKGWADPQDVDNQGDDTE